MGRFHLGLIRHGFLSIYDPIRKWRPILRRTILNSLEKPCLADLLPPFTQTRSSANKGTWGYIVLSDERTREVGGKFKSQDPRVRSSVQQVTERVAQS